MVVAISMMEMTEKSYHESLRSACDSAVKVASIKLLQTLEDHGDDALKAMLKGYSVGDIVLGPDFYPWLKKDEEKKDGA